MTLLDLKRDAGGRFVVGTVPPRKQPGQRNKFSERFTHDLHEFWKVHGPEIMMRAALQNPSAFMRSMAIFNRPASRDMPVEEHSELEHLQTVEEVVEAVRAELGDAVAIPLAKSLGIKLPKVIEDKT